MSKKPNSSTIHSQANKDARGASEDNRCKVCFTNTARISKDESRQSRNTDFDFVSCRKCGLACHKGCYDLTIKDKTFMCDSCRDSGNSSCVKTCLVCKNEGLLKKIGKTHYAHVACALFYLNPKIKNYFSLQFSGFDKDLKLSQKQVTKCNLCKKTSGYVQQCPYDNCQSKCHLYCCLKYHNPEGLTDWSVMVLWNSGAKTSQAHRNELIACSAHYGRYIQCCRGSNHQNSNYIMCDQCMQWYHNQCLKITEDQISIEPFFCRYCKQWNKKSSQNIFQMQTYPKLHLYDFLLILRSYQKSKDKKSLQLIKRFPFVMGSLQNASNSFQLFQKVQKASGDLLSQILVKSTVQSINNHEINDQLFEIFQNCFQIKGKSQNSKQKLLPKQRQGRQLKQTAKTLKELKDLIKQVPSSQIHKDTNIDYLFKLIKNPTDFSLSLQVLIHILEESIKYESIEQVYAEVIEVISAIKSRSSYNPRIKIQNLSIFDFANYPLTERQKYSYYHVFIILKDMCQIKSYKKHQTQKYQLYLTNIIGEYNKLPEQYQLVLAKASNKLNVNLQQTSANQRIVKWIKNNRLSLEEYESFRLNLQSLYHLDIRDRLEYEYYELKMIEKKLEKSFSMEPNADNIRFLRVSIQTIQKQFTLKYPEDKLQKYKNYLYEFDCLSRLVTDIQQFYLTSGLSYSLPVNYDQYLYFLENYFVFFSNQSIPLVSSVFEICYSLSTIRINIKFKNKLSIGFQCLVSMTDISTIQGENIQKWNKCIKHYGVQFSNKTDFLIREQEFKKWLSIKIDYLQSHYIAYLSDSNKIQQFLAMIQDAQSTASNLKLKITKYKKILKILELWANITMKASEMIAHKATPGAIKQILEIMKSAKYPQQIHYFQKLSILYQKVKDLQNTVNKFKKASNNKQQIDVCLQVSCVQSKIKQSDIKKIITKLNQTFIDYKFQIGDIETELDYFRSKQKQAEEAYRSQNQEEMAKLFRYFLYDTAFMYQKFKEFRNKLRSLQCMRIPKSRKEYQKLLRWGGPEVETLIANCKGILDAYNRLEDAELSMIKKKRHQYLSIQEVASLRQKLFEEEKKKLIVSQWINEFNQIEEKATFVFTRMNSKYYSPQLIESYIKVYDKLPIKSTTYHKLIQLKSLARKLETQFRAYTDDWQKQCRPLSDNDTKQLLDLVFKLRENRLTLPQLSWNINQIEIYSQIIDEEPSDHEDYLLYLTKCNALPSQLRTKTLFRKRLDLFQQNKNLISQSNYKQQAEKYVQQAIILKNLNSEALISSGDIQKLIQIMQTKPSSRSGIKRMRSHQKLQMADSQSEGYSDENSNEDSDNEFDDEDDDDDDGEDGSDQISPDQSLNDDEDQSNESQDSKPKDPKKDKPINEIVIDDDDD